LQPGALGQCCTIRNTRPIRWACQYAYFTRILILATPIRDQYVFCSLLYSAVLLRFEGWMCTPRHEDPMQRPWQGPEHVNGAGAAGTGLAAGLQAVTRRLQGGFSVEQAPAAFLSAPSGAARRHWNPCAQIPFVGASSSKNGKTAKSREPANVLATYWPRIGRCAKNTRMIRVFGSAGSRIVQHCSRHQGLRF
jgi:hypothetical protein